MNEENKQDGTITPAGAVELDERELEQAAGGASDYLLEIDGIKGETQLKISGQSSQKVSPLRTGARLGDGSV